MTQQPHGVLDITGIRPGSRTSGELIPLADRQWRRAVLAVHHAELAYRQLLADAQAPQRRVDLAWLDLWRAERHRDHLLRFMRDTEQP